MRMWTVLVGVTAAGGAILLGAREHQRSKEVAALADQVRALANPSVSQTPATAPAPAFDSNALHYQFALAAARQGEATDAAAPSNAARAPERPGQGAEADQGMSSEEMHTRLEATLARGGPNPEWTRSLRQDVSERLRARAGATDSRLRAVDCRNEICRVELDHASRADYERFMSDTVLDPTAPIWSTPSFTSIEPSPDGRVVAVSFVARSNEPLPLDD